MSDRKCLHQGSGLWIPFAAVAALVVLAGIAQVRVSTHLYHHHLPGKANWRLIPAYIVSDDTLLFESLRASFHRPRPLSRDVQTLAPATSSAPAMFIADVGIGWRNLGKGRWMWSGTFVGSYPPPATPTIARGIWVGGTGRWTTIPHDSRKWMFAGSFNGPMPPSPPGPQRGSLAGFVGAWKIDRNRLVGKTWTWHGSWTGEVRIR
jgi:hypothetical protein